MDNRTDTTEEKRYFYTHRVGAATAGLCMIGFGILFLLNIFGGWISYGLIFSLWPLILICLGLELLVSLFEQKKIIYDKGAIFLLIIMTLFAMVLALTDIGMEYMRMYD